MPSRFLQIHTLTSYPAALLNRDDVGLAKRLPFGGASRIRVSSQCLKRHWRTDEGPYALSEIAHDEGTVPMTVRSRLTFAREVYGPLVSEPGIDRLEAIKVTGALIDVLLGKSKSRNAKNEKALEEAIAEGDEEKETKILEEMLETGQVTVLGRPEVEYFQMIAREILADDDVDATNDKEVNAAVKAFFKRDAKKNLDALRQPLHMGLDAALFGRMVTSDILSRCDAAIHVAHAFTVHAAEAEPDYFSAVDDLRAAEGKLGGGHINTTELTSGLYYGYVVVDVPLLVSNLTGCPQDEWESLGPQDRALAGEVIRRLVQLIATTSPGAKLGSTAPYSYAQMMLVEAGGEPPRSLANAFQTPVPAEGQVLGTAYDQLATAAEELDENYGAPSDGRALLAMGSKEKLDALNAEPMNLRDLAAWAAARVTDGAA